MVFIDTLAMLVPYFLSKKHHAISISSIIGFPARPSQICHNFPGVSQPHAFLCSVGAINQHFIPRSEFLGFEEDLDGNQFLGRGD